MSTTIMRFAACASVLFTLFGTANAGKITTFQVPGATNTVSYAINLKGEVSGWWTSPDEVAHGFIRDAHGIITTFDLSGYGAPNATAGAVNRKGAVVGNYRYSQKRYRAFLRKSDGSTLVFHVPGARQTVPQGINANGDIAGVYLHGPGGSGFVRSKNGLLTEFDVPNCTGTYPTGLNGPGEVAGLGVLCSGGRDSVGFVRTTDGAIETFTVNDVDTEAFAINDAGAVTGTAVNAETSSIGFVRAPDGTVTTFSVTDAFRTEGRAINSGGTIAGDFDGGGFVRAADGTITTFAVPDKSLIWPTGINDKGVVTGTAQDNLGKQAVGFIWRP